LCQDCYNETSVCDLCGERHYSCNVAYNRETDKYECFYCREKIKETEILF
jgi:hypothetical protein